MFQIKTIKQKNKLKIDNNTIYILTVAINGAKINQEQIVQIKL